MSNVDHPNHYQSESGLEVIDVIKAFTSELSGEEAFCIGNAIKYICRYSKKNGVEDLEKAKWYIDRAISVRSGRLTTIRKKLNTVCTNSVYGAENVQKEVKGAVMHFDTVGRYLFASREEASKVLNELQSTIHEYGYVTLADLHDLCELAIPSPDYKAVGWKSPSAFHIKPTGDGWELAFYVWPENIEHD